MSDRGVFAVDRGVFDHPIFADEPFTEREAWVWLVGQCAWEPKRVRVGGAMIELARGQCAYSLRFMATKWKWSEPRVRRFLNRLKTDAMVSVSTTQKVTHITVCNYDKYAFGRRNNEPQNDALPDAAATQQRRKEEEPKEPKKEEKNIRAVADATRPAEPDPFEEFWKSYPKRDGANPKAPARKKFLAHIKSGVDPQIIISGARRYAAEMRTKGQFATPYVAQAITWLNQQRYDDYRPPPGPQGGLPIAPAGAPTDEQLRKRYGSPAIPAKTEAAGTNGSSPDHPPELSRAGFAIRPVVRTM